MYPDNKTEQRTIVNLVKTMPITLFKFLVLTRFVTTSMSYAGGQSFQPAFSGFRAPPRHAGPTARS